MRARAWKAFLPISPALKSDEAPDADAAWLLARGIEPEALSLLTCLRCELLPRVRGLGRKLAGFHFLVHSRAEGVPCPPEDSRAFIDLSLYFKEPTDPREKFDRWCWVAPRQGDDKIDGAIALLNAQSALHVRLVESYAGARPLDALMQIRQSLHYFANMSQMRIA